MIKRLSTISRELLYLIVSGTPLHTDVEYEQRGLLLCNPPPQIIIVLYLHILHTVAQLTVL